MNRFYTDYKEIYKKDIEWLEDNYFKTTKIEAIVLAVVVLIWVGKLLN